MHLVRGCTQGFAEVATSFKEHPGATTALVAGMAGFGLVFPAAATVAGAVGMASAVWHAGEGIYHVTQDLHAARFARAEQDFEELGRAVAELGQDLALGEVAKGSDVVQVLNTVEQVSPLVTGLLHDSERSKARAESGEAAAPVAG